MKFKIVPCLFFALLIMAALSRAERIQTEEAALKACFPEALSFSAQSDPHVLVAKGKGGHVLGSAVISEELGKHQPITFMVALDAQGKVKRVELLQYRERYGGGIVARRFMGQFEGKSAEDPLIVGKDIDAVSGATISSKSIAKGVRKAFATAKASIITGKEKH